MAVAAAVVVAVAGTRLDLHARTTAVAVPVAATVAIAATAPAGLVPTAVASAVLAVGGARARGWCGGATGSRVVCTA